MFIGDPYSTFQMKILGSVNLKKPSYFIASKSCRLLENAAGSFKMGKNGS